MPNKIFEAIASGRPVLASNFGKIKDLVTNTGCGVLCNSTNADGVLNCIISLKKKPNLQKKGRRRSVEITRSWENIEHVLLSIYAGESDKNAYSKKFVKVVEDLT